MLASEWPLLRGAVRVRDAAEPAASAAPPAPTFARLAAAKARVPAAIISAGRARWEGVVNAAPLPRGPPGMASRAYHKLKEIQLSCALPPARRSVHLCEAPGGFVQATAEAAAPEWRWTAASLACRIRPAPNLPRERGDFLADLPCAGDLRDAACAAAVVARAGPGAADLVTADGAAEMDHADLDAAHLPLLAAQTGAAVRCLAPGGTFVCKFFEGAAPSTRAWLAWLTTQFADVGVIKPTASRATNSERYVVARGYAVGGAAPPEDWARCAVAAAWDETTAALLARMAATQAAALERALAGVARD